MKYLCAVLLFSFGIEYGCGTQNVHVFVPGTYTGKLPCADCPGIQYTLKLLPDSTYCEEMIYLERNVKPYVHSGKYAMKNDSVLVLEEATGTGQSRFFLFSGEKLSMLDRMGRPIESKLTNHYLLKRSKTNR